MRIISGKYRGHQLVSFSADHIRPTTDRVKESLFNMIQGSVDGARVLDLFSGTGNLGLEALSRGAASVLFVEKSRKSIQILEKNLAKLKVSEPYQILQKDVISFLQNYQGEPFDLIFADPPFTEAMAHDVMLAADGSRAFHPQTLMMIESARREKILDDYPHLSRYDEREFGDKVLSFFQKKTES
ncbi:MAG: 16S rRNA (guanine(966)-N(2))-methyltransferase RsmD [Pseudobdellovibrionaceae bacterium]